MNLTGKIFVVLIFVMSLVFMTMTIITYSTHTKWMELVELPADQVARGKPLGLRHQLADSRKQNETLRAAHEQLSNTLTALRAASDQRIAQLTETNGLLTQERATWEAQEAQLNQDSRDAVAAMNAAQTTLEKMREELDGLQDQVRTAEADRDNHFNEMVNKTDQLHQAAGELRRLTGRTIQLGEQIARTKNVLAAHDLSEFENVSGIPPRVDAKVLAVRQGGLIEISGGSDEGLQRGHRLEVYRHGPERSRYLGAIRILQTQPDKSVAQIISETLVGTIEKEDRVASRLR